MASLFLTMRDRVRTWLHGCAQSVPAILGVALFIVVFDNNAFWTAALRATASDHHQVGIIVAFFAILLCTSSIVLSLSVGPRSLKALAAVLLVVASIAGFFMNEYGVVIDTSIIRSIADTEVREASPLLTTSFFFHVAVFGMVPAAALSLLPVRRKTLQLELAARAWLIGCSALVLLGAVRTNYGPVAYFAHEHRQIRLMINPGYPIYSAAVVLLSQPDRLRLAAERTPLDAWRKAPLDATQRHNAVIFVLGETARADRFSYNGYARDTNRYTRGSGAINFPHVSSCGTSTADSVPCLFSPLGRNRFSHAAFATQERPFDLFERLAIAVAWRDNSTGCKDICTSEHFEEFAALRDPKLCDESGCFDEILLGDLASELADRTRDHLIVLHQRGSHGPAYYSDTPQWAKEFLPECDLPNLRNCSRSSINNAYDNTILYTDYFLSKAIEFLKTQDDFYDVALLYVSDHGESLGENGLYLHGFPYALAPPEQTHVPMLFWASDNFYTSQGIDEPCVEDATNAEYSHDAIFHTLLPIFGIETSVYSRELDLFASCRVERSQRPLPQHSTRAQPATEMSSATAIAAVRD